MSEVLKEYFEQQGVKSERYEARTSTVPSSTETTEKYRYVGDTAPTSDDWERIAESKYNVESYNSLMGTLASASVEIGAGIGMSLYASKAANAMKWAKKARVASLAGVVAPEPTTTALGAVGFAATEAAIWGFSNFLGQTTRKAFGIQEHYSAGEMVASAVFGTSVAAAQATKLIQLGPSLQSMKAWGSAPVVRETGKAFVSGASLGLAESLLRQEMQMLLNERETRDSMDYVFSAGAGGGFNTLFSIFGRTGAWGLMKAADSAQNAKKVAYEQLEKAKKIKNPRKRRKEVKKIQDAITALDEIETSFRGAEKAERDYHKNAPEPEHVNNPSNDPRQAPKLEPLEKPKPTKKTPEEEPDAPTKETPEEEPEAPAKEDLLEELSYRELQAAAKKQGIKANLKKEELKKQLEQKKKETPDEGPTKEEATPDESPLSERRARIEELKKDFIANQKNRPEKMGKWLPNLQRTSQQIKDELEPEIDYLQEDIIGKYQRGEEFEVDYLLELVQDLRALNETDGIMKTAEGRGMQANRQDAARYVWETDLSVRALKEDAALFDLQEALIRLRDTGEADSLEKQFDDFFADVPTEDRDKYRRMKKMDKEAEVFDSLPRDKQQKIINNKAYKALGAAYTTLKKQLNKERAKVVSDFKLSMNNKHKEKLAKEVKKRLKEDPTVQMLEAQIGYYRKATKEAESIAKAQKELARLAKLEGEGTMGQKRAEVEGKPKFDDPESELSKLRKRIAQSKTRMRQQLKDIDNARNETLKMDMFLAMQSHAMRNIEGATSNKLVQFGRDVRAARKLALIDQLPSVLAGVPTGVGLALRSAVRPWVMMPLDFARYGGDTATALAMAEFKGMFSSILNWKGTGTSMARTFSTGVSATDRVMSKYLEESSAKYLRAGNNPTAKRAVETAKARARKEKDPMNSVLDFKNNAGWALLSLGVRGISAIDDGFRRQLLRGRLDTAARRKALLENPNNPKGAEEAYNNYIKTMWKSRNGLDVLENYKEFLDDVNDINQNLLFSAQMDDPDLFHKNAGEQLISMFSEKAKGDDALAFFIDAFMPYISVPIRGVYRGVRFTAAPLVAIRGAAGGPYGAKIKDRQLKIEVAETELMKMDSSNKLYAAKAEEIKNLSNEIEILKARQVKYKEDAMVDTAFGGSLLMLGFGAALFGEATGSLNWMSPDQQEKNKLKPFQAFGVDYSAAAPWAIPIAIGADMAAYLQAREAGVLKEHQNMLFMLSTTLVNVAEQVPMMQGFETLTAMLSGGQETKAKLLGRLAATYFPIPAQIRKTLMAATEDETIGDLRGGTFEQRAAYAFFGVKPINRKTDYFGEDVKSGKTWVQHAIIRQAPSKGSGLETNFERVLASDVFDNIQAFPSSLGNRIKMTQFINEDGVTLQYAYAQRLKNYKMYYKGRKLTIKQAVNKLISSPSFRKMHREMTISKTQQHNNEGLRELNRLMQSYYKAVKEDIIADDRFTKRFVNRKNERLFDVIYREETTVQGINKPIRDLIMLNNQ